MTQTCFSFAPLLCLHFFQSVELQDCDNSSRSTDYPLKLSFQFSSQLPLSDWHLAFKHVPFSIARAQHWMFLPKISNWTLSSLSPIIPVDQHCLLWWQQTLKSFPFCNTSGVVFSAASCAFFFLIGQGISKIKLNYTVVTKSQLKTIVWSLG